MTNLLAAGHAAAEGLTILGNAVVEGASTVAKHSGTHGFFGGLLSRNLHRLNFVGKKKSS